MTEHSQAPHHRATARVGCQVSVLGMGERPIPGRPLGSPLRSPPLPPLQDFAGE
jgi:hypothetical protein